MKNLANFLLFQGAWYAAVEGAARGSMWLGPAAVAAIVLVHLMLVSGWRRELGYVLGVGALGAVLDSGLSALGATLYPTSSGVWSELLPGAWPEALAPPWIISLWIAFATLPRLWLAWLRKRGAAMAALLGAIGGPLSYFAGTRLGAVAAADPAWWTWIALSLEYAIVTPLLFKWAAPLESRNKS